MTLKCANNALWVTLFALNSATFVHAQFGRGGGDWMANSTASFTSCCATVSSWLICAGVAPAATRVCLNLAIGSTVFHFKASSGLS